MSQECLRCGSQAACEITRERRVTVNGNELVVPEDRITRCGDCGEEFYTGAQARMADRKLIDARRRAEHLLTSDEIRRLREALKLSQHELEQAIGTGPKTFVRWESGTAVQSKSADDVLRLIALDPDNLRLLVRIRESAICTLVERRLETERMKKKVWIEETISSALDALLDLDPELTNKIVKSVSRAIRTHKTQRIERVKETIVA
ncbi:MAG: type II TA system antitoxin MqsA family protein [Vulcanimicrobiaceae bacterium]